MGKNDLVQKTLSAMAYLLESAPPAEPKLEEMFATFEKGLASTLSSETWDEPLDAGGASTRSTHESHMPEEGAAAGTRRSLCLHDDVAEKLDERVPSRRRELFERNNGDDDVMHARSWR